MQQAVLTQGTGAGATSGQTIAARLVALIAVKQCQVESPVGALRGHADPCITGRSKGVHGHGALHEGDMFGAGHLLQAEGLLEVAYGDFDRPSSVNQILIIVINSICKIDLAFVFPVFPKPAFDIQACLAQFSMLLCPVIIIKDSKINLQTTAEFCAEGGLTAELYASLRCWHEPQHAERKTERKNTRPGLRCHATDPVAVEQSYRPVQPAQWEPGRPT